jgi:hypothetical protein
MFEITVIEKKVEGDLIMAHWAVNDDEIDHEVEIIRDQEDRCVAAGHLINWTIITCYQQFNTPENYARPEAFVMLP